MIGWRLYSPYPEHTFSKRGRSRLNARCHTVGRSPNNHSVIFGVTVITFFTHGNNAVAAKCVEARAAQITNVAQGSSRRCYLYHHHRAQNLRHQSPHHRNTTDNRHHRHHHSLYYHRHTFRRSRPEAGHPHSEGGSQYNLQDILVGCLSLNYSHRHSDYPRHRLHHPYGRHRHNKARSRRSLHCKLRHHQRKHSSYYPTLGRRIPPLVWCHRRNNRPNRCTLHCSAATYSMHRRCCSRRRRPHRLE